MEERIVPGSIVVGVDGSDHANRAVVWAAEQAELEGRDLVVVHGVAHQAYADGDWVALWGIGRAEVDQILTAAARGILDEAAALASSVRPGLAVRPLLLQRDPREALVAASTRASLVVVGARGHSSWLGLLLGSVSAGVTRHAHCPVVVVDGPAGDVPRHGVLVGADGTADSRPVIEFAFRHASQRGLPLTVMHCFWDIVGERAHGRRVTADDPGLEDLRLTLAESVAGFSEKFPDVEVTLELSRGLVDLALAGSTPPHDLVVVGRHDPSSWARLLHGSATTTVLERADGNVAVVPEPRADVRSREATP